MPRLWTDTIDEHRRAVQDAILEQTAALVKKHGLSSVTMSQIAEATGIGRATLYKYFPDVDAILHAWHESKVSEHIQQLEAVRDKGGDAAERLEGVLTEYALITHERHEGELVALLHRADHVAHAQARLQKVIRDLVAEGAKARQFRDDVSADELATYCLHALTAASSLTSKAAVHRLVGVTLAALRRPR